MLHLYLPTDLVIFETFAILLVFCVSAVILVIAVAIVATLVTEFQELVVRLLPRRRRRALMWGEQQALLGYEVRVDAWGNEAWLIEDVGMLQENWKRGTREHWDREGKESEESEESDDSEDDAEEGEINNLVEVGELRV